MCILSVTDKINGFYPKMSISRYPHIELRWHGMCEDRYDLEEVACL
jgi:hypothetical protein